MTTIKTSWIVLGIGAVLVLWVWSTYNGLIKANIAVDTQWAQVETQYQRRVDLIPNLVASVQGIFTQEKEIFSTLAQARQNYSGARTVNEKVAAANQVEGALGRLLVITENYPVLTSSETVKSLMSQLEGTENRVSVERTRFNDAVGVWNGKLLTFPSNVVGKLFGFEKRDFFKADVGAEKAPTVKLN